MDISSRFSRFLANIRPSHAQLEAASQQVAVLKEQLSRHIAADHSYHLEKIFRAGSSAKHTDLARKGKNTFDIDLGVYYRAQGHKEEQLKQLLPYTHRILRKIYPGKAAQDIHLGKNAINITFRTSRLQVDVVPIVRDQRLKQKNSGWIPRQDQWRLTSISSAGSEPLKLWQHCLLSCRLLSRIYHGCSSLDIERERTVVFVQDPPLFQSSSRAMCILLCVF